MNDKELLEMAAKAIGFIWDNYGICGEGNWFANDGYRESWNPLEDDGDALNLACRLCMTISTGPCQVSASTIEGALRGFFPRENTIKQCQSAAVRRAIVRSAAEVGESKP